MCVRAQRRRMWGRSTRRYSISYAISDWSGNRYQGNGDGLFTRYIDVSDLTPMTPVTPVTLLHTKSALAVPQALRHAPRPTCDMVCLSSFLITSSRTRDVLVQGVCKG
jgi:hypothetical protein